MSLNRAFMRTLMTSGALIAAGAFVLAQQPAPPAPAPPRDPHANEVPAPKNPPRVVTAGATVGAPPSDAIVLFDGTDLSKWEKEKGDGPAAWTVAEGVMTVKPGTGGIRTKQAFGDVQLHVEWATPSPAHGTGQDRGNSGIFLQSTYEVQVLDSFENETYWHGSAGSIYKQYAPLVNVDAKARRMAGVRHRLPRAGIQHGRARDEACHVHGVPQRRADPGSRRGDGCHHSRGTAVLQGARGQAADLTAGPQSHGEIPQHLAAGTLTGWG